MSAWGTIAATAAKRLADSPAGRKVAQEAAGAVSRAVASGGSGVAGKWQSARRQRDLATKLARQVRGQLSEAVFIGSTQAHWVVWKDGVPMAAFPPVEGDLTERVELQHVTDDDRFDPPSV